MAARVALLILATGMFVVLWSGDHPDPIAAVSQPVPANEYQPIDDSSPQRSTEQTTSAPLPDFVSPGTFLVVDQFGRTQIRTISEDDFAVTGRSGRMLVSDHYSVEASGTRWHYIRLDQNLPAQTAASSAMKSSIR